MMCNNPCSYLDRIPNQEASLYLWERELGAWRGFVFFKKRFMIKSGNFAYSIPCDECNLHCPRKVKHFGDGAIEAICPEDSEKHFSVTKLQIEIWRLDKIPFHAAICGALNLQAQPSGKETCFATWRIGEYNVANTYYPVYVTYPPQKKSFEKAITHLSSLADTPFILLSPTRKYIRETTENIISKKSVFFISFEQAFSITEKAELQAVPEWDRAIAQSNNNIQKAPVHSLEMPAKNKKGISLPEAARGFVTYLNETSDINGEAEKYRARWYKKISALNPIGKGKKRRSIYDCDRIANFILLLEKDNACPNLKDLQTVFLKRAEDIIQN